MFLTPSSASAGSGSSPAPRRIALARLWYAARGAALEHAHLRHCEADALAAIGGEQHVVLLGADLHVNDCLAVLQLHRDDAGRPHVGEIAELVAADGAAGGCKHHVERGPV